jgi:hypothetical protein
MFSDHNTTKLHSNNKIVTGNSASISHIFENKEILLKKFTGPRMNQNENYNILELHTKMLHFKTCGM